MHARHLRTTKTGRELRRWQARPARAVPQALLRLSSVAAHTRPRFGNVRASIRMTPRPGSVTKHSEGSGLARVWRSNGGGGSISRMRHNRASKKCGHVFSTDQAATESAQPIKTCLTAEQRALGARGACSRQLGSQAVRACRVPSCDCPATGLAQAQHPQRFILTKTGRLTRCVRHRSIAAV